MLDFVSSLDEDVVVTTSQKAFESLPNVSKAISELTVLKGVGPATASAVLAAYAPDVAPFMSDEVQIIYSCFGSNVNLGCLALFLKSIYLAANPKMIIQLLNNMIITFGSSLPLDKYVMLTINSVFVMLKIIKLFMTST